MQGVLHPFMTGRPGRENHQGKPFFLVTLLVFHTKLVLLKSNLQKSLRTHKKGNEFMKFIKIFYVFHKIGIIFVFRFAKPIFIWI